MTAPTFAPIYRDRPLLYVPAFDIKINGSNLPQYAVKDVTEVIYRDSVDRIDSFEITVNNWDAKPAGGPGQINLPDFKYTGASRGGSSSTPPAGAALPPDRLFYPARDKTIEIWMGYFNPTANRSPAEHNGMRCMLTGLITRVTPNFPSSGQPTLKISGSNFLRSLMNRQITEVYRNKGASQIARQIHDRRPMRLGNRTFPIRTAPQPDPPEEIYPHLLQKNQYDIVFLLQLAHRNGYDLALRGEGADQHLFFGPVVQTDRDSYRLEWGKSLIQFQPSLTTSQQISAITVYGWNAEQGRRIEVTVNRSELSGRGPRDGRNLDSIEEGFRERTEVIADQPFRSVAEARQYAISRLRENASDIITGRGSTVGTPGLRAGRLIQIDGLGSTFSGQYVVKSTTHTINASGYTTEFEVSL